jgi:hypothetical protein
MSNLTLFQSGSTVPDYLRDASDATTKEIAGGSGGKQISIKGGVWRMIVGGEEVAKNEDRAMNIVVLAAGKGVTRTYYAEKYEEGKDIMPACWSAEGVVPNEEVQAPQNASCATCPQNIEGSGEGKSRACRFSKRLAVSLENDLGGNVYRMSVPAKSYFGRADGDKMPLQAYSKFLAGHGIPITGVVTEARFDTSEAVPVLKFRAIRPLARDEWEQTKALSQTKDAQDAIEFKMVPSRTETKALFAASASAAPKPAAAKTAAAKTAERPAATDTASASVAEPVRRAKPAAESVAPARDVDAILSDWATDDE